MKKKIIFMLINMNVGGTEKAFLNMLAELPKEKFDITMLLLEKFGGFIDSVPDHVHVKYLHEYKQLKDILNLPLHVKAFNFFKTGNWIKAVLFLFLYIYTKTMKERSALFKYVLKDIPFDENEYDMAVAYAGPMDFISYFVIHKIKAKKKIQWIHFDITKIGFNQAFAKKIYKKFDQIFVVSEEGKKKLIELLPDLKAKTDTFYNIISPKSIKEMANRGDGFNDKFSGIRILTVGRLTKEKGQDLTIPVLSSLRKAGYEIRWYCIGEGNARFEYETLIEKFNVKDDFILLGAKTNPYPFMKQCDLYVQPSRHEGYCITLAEAKNFRKPIVSTDFTGAREQIRNNQSGLIVNFDEDQMFSAVKRILDDQNLRTMLENNSLNNVLNTSSEFKKLISMV
jgi:glycosyltransferase involved in cell wall biosynthesis